MTKHQQTQQTHLLLVLGPAFLSPLSGTLLLGLLLADLNESNSYKDDLRSLAGDCRRTATAPRGENCLTEVSANFLGEKLDVHSEFRTNLGLKNTSDPRDVLAPHMESVAPVSVSLSFTFSYVVVQ